MAIDITTLDIEDGTDMTYVLLGRDRTSSEWLDTTGTTAGVRRTLTIRQQLVAANPRNGTPALRRINVQVRSTNNTDGTNDVKPPEVMTVNFTLTKPETFESSWTLDSVKNVVALMRNFVSAANVAKLVNGEV